MTVVPLAATGKGPETPAAKACKCDESDWIRIAAAGSLATGGVLLMAGKRRAGMVTAVAGATLAVIDQKEAVCEWWRRLPGYLDEMQSVLGRVQGAVDELSAQGERLRNALSK